MLRALSRAVGSAAKRGAFEIQFDLAKRNASREIYRLQSPLISTSSENSAQQQDDLATKSHVIGPNFPPLLADTISSNLRRTVQKYPSNNAIISIAQKQTLTYKQFLNKVEDIAIALLSLGTQKQDRIALWAANSLEWTVIQYATAMIGAIQVSLNPALKETELVHALTRSGTSIIILAPEFKGESQISVLHRVQHEIPTLKHTILLNNTSVGEEETIPSDWLRWSNFINNKNGHAASKGDLHSREQSLHIDDPINLQFTSGTTGLPKAATLTHTNVVNNGYMIGHLLSYSDLDKVCIPVPLFHCFGQVLGNLACTTHGATMVYPGPVFDPGAVLRSVESEKCTSLYGVPSQFISELEHPEFGKFRLNSLRTGIMAGAPCPEHIMRRVRKEMSMTEISICFGQTETSPVSFQTLKDDSEERRVSTVGTVHPHVEACVVGPETHEIVDRGVSGELWVRGYSVMKGYWNDSEATKSTIDSQGWCHTGDLAVLDDQGYCKIVGRIKDMVLRGGECLFPREIEEFLHHHPVISDVQVFGVPDERMGEQLCAWVKLKRTNNENMNAMPSRREAAGVSEMVSEIDLKKWCIGKISKHKVPKYWKIVTEFPTTASGKPQKYIMRREAIKELGLEVVAATATTTAEAAKMPTTGEEKDSIQLLYAPCLFLPTADGEDVAAPVVILQNDGANIYSILESHIHPNYLSQPDKFWKIVRNITNPPFETWRPRVYGVQLKMLQNARLPCNPQEWAGVGEALTSLTSYLQTGSSPESFLRDLQAFVRSVEQWWGGRKREGSGSLKRNASAAAVNGLANGRAQIQPANKRLAVGDSMLPINFPSESLLAAAGLDASSFLPPGLQTLPPPDHLAMPPPPAGLIGMDTDLNRVFNMNNITEMQMEAAANGLVAAAAAANGGGNGNNTPPPAAAAGNAAWLRKIVTLNVGGKTFSTTLATLTAVEGSYLWKLAHKIRSTNSSEYFLDRSGDVFSCVLDYLRCQRYNEDPKSTLPEDTSALKLLKREAAFYKLTGLEKEVADALTAAAGAPCDAVFLQTGFVKDGESLTKAHAELLMRLNAELKVKAQQGFEPAERQCGTEAQGELRNIWTHILLTKPFG